MPTSTRSSESAAFSASNSRCTSLTLRLHCITLKRSAGKIASRVRLVVCSTRQIGRAPFGANYQEVRMIRTIRRRLKIWERRHPKARRIAQAIVDLHSIAMGFWLAMVIAADAILLASHLAGRTASQQGVLFGITAKIIWMMFAGVCTASAVQFWFYVKSTTSRLQGPIALLACTCAVLFSVRIDTMCGRMI